MGPSSAMRKMRWRNPWQLVFLAAAILSSYFLLIEGQGVITPLQIQLQPEHPIEGQNVTLTPKYTLTGAIVCRWFRGRTTETNRLILSYFYPGQRPGPVFTKRETAGPGCTLHISNLTSADTESYTVNVENLQLNVQGYGFVIVSENLTSPLLVVSPQNKTMTENASVILTCHTSNQIDVSVFWLKNRDILTNPTGDLSNRNRSLTFRRISRNDSGTYRCMAKNRITHPQSNPVEILVTYGPRIKLNPEGIVFRRLKSELLVECLVDSVPEAKLQWFFNTNEQKETGSIFKVLIRNQSDTGAYTCMATNPITNHTDERTCYVILRKGHLSAGAIVGIVIGALAGISLVAVRLYFLYKKTSFRVKVQPPTLSGEVEETPQAD